MAAATPRSVSTLG